MILHVSRFRFFVPMLIGLSIDSFVGGLLVHGLNIIEILPYLGGSVVGVGIATLLIPIKKLNVILEEDRLCLPSKNGFSRPIEVLLSEIDLSKSRIGRFGEGRITTIDGDEFVISTVHHSRKNIRNLFEEIQSNQKKAV